MTRPKWLSELLNQGTVAHSRVRSAAAHRILETLQMLDLVQIVTHKTRRTIRVINPPQFAHWIVVSFPELKADSATLAPRAQNIARKRNSKAGTTTHTVQPVLFKWFEAKVSAPLAQLTRKYGLVAATSDHLKQLPLPPIWHLLTVENWESFYTLNYALPPSPMMSVYLSGNVSDVVLIALAALVPPPTSVLHFGDYDWTGLTIFQRLKARLSQAKLYITPNIDELFQRYVRSIYTIPSGNLSSHVSHSTMLAWSKK